jgi:hypothetical protein
MHKHALNTAAALVITVCAAPSPAASQELLRERLRNEAGIELLGKAALGSVYYQYTPFRWIGLEAGIGAYQTDLTGERSLSAFFPIGAKVYLLPNDGTVFLAGGITLLTEKTDSGPFDETDSYGYAGIGYEYRAGRRIVLRGALYGLFAEGDTFAWPGFSVGYAF